MITESVKTILGADLSNQVEAALKGKGKDGKDVDLVVGNDGTFVPADKYNGANPGGRHEVPVLHRQPRDWFC